VDAETKTYEGVALAEGIAIGKARLVDTAHLPTRAPRYEIGADHVHREIERLHAACTAARKDLEALAERAAAHLGRSGAEMMRAQALMVDDPAFLADVEVLVAEKHLNAEAAVADVIGQFEGLVASLDDPYLRERSTDIRDAGRRILGRLLFVSGQVAQTLAEPAVVVADHLVPSLTVHLDRGKVLGLAGEHGGYTSHAAILARSLGVPAVSGLEGLSEEVLDGEVLILDGFRGIAIARPSPEQVEAYEQQAAQVRTGRLTIISHAAEPAVTRDGCRIAVLANVGGLEEVELAREYRADGIGLYRTEVDYLSGSSLPSEDHLAEEYRQAAETFGEAGVVFRVLDIGGDKFPPSVPLAHEDNPFIGLRGLRLLLEHVEDLMLPQLRAIVRASVGGRVCVMYPMIASLADFQAACDVFQRALREATAAGHPVARPIAEGAMIEVPSCVPMLPELMEMSDFASVGTNDLVQYLLAADRNSERMAAAYDSFHPAVIRTLATIQRAADTKDISVCGEVASDACFLPLLIGLGYAKVSVNVGAVPRVKEAVRGLSREACGRLAERVLQASTALEVRTAAQEFVASQTESS